MSEFLEHVEARLSEAEESISRARQMLKDPHPGLTTWMFALGSDIEAARDALDKALVMP